MSVLEAVVQKLSQKPFEWVRDEPTADDLAHIQKEGNAPSQFDPLGLRKEMTDNLASGKAVLITKRGPFAKVLAVVAPGTKIPWKTLGQIFSAFGPPKQKTFGPPKDRPFWRVVWFAHPKKREITESPITPEHINGGYAYSCAPETIIIYREEEIERVLVHELLHAACTDDMSNPEWMREVLTETWAELFLVGILADGSLRKAKKLWAIQAQWIANQELMLRKNNINSSQDYPWRYTVGRRLVLQQFGITLPPPNSDTGNSLRFTSALLLPEQ
jgi:hypothetical protein